MSKDEHHSGIAMLSFLTGTVIGAAVTLLVSPKTGKEIRELLADYSEDIKKRTSDFSQDFDFKGQTESLITQGKDLIERGRELITKGSEMVGQGKEFVEDKKNTLSAAIEAGKEAMEKEKEVVAEKPKKGKK